MSSIDSWPGGKREDKAGRVRVDDDDDALPEAGAAKEGAKSAANESIGVGGSSSETCTRAACFLSKTWWPMKTTPGRRNEVGERAEEGCAAAAVLDRSEDEGDEGGANELRKGDGLGGGLRGCEPM